MELLLMRRYSPRGVNGLLQFQGQILCSTIELPWRDNLPQISCIPEGKYRIAKRHSPRFGWHFEIEAVSGRNSILFHPANDAEKELRGCIAPVLRHTGEGKGEQSRMALDKLKKALYPLLDQGHEIFLTIKNNSK